MDIQAIDFGYYKLPDRAYDNDAGLDCYAKEDFTLPSFKEYGIDYKKVEEDKISIEDVKIDIANFGTRSKYYKQLTVQQVPLGFGLHLSDGYVALIMPRSSMNKQGVITDIGVIDSSYTGEIKAFFINLNDKPVTFEKGNKICQILIMPIAICNIVKELKNKRGTRGIGSSGK